MKLVEQYPNTGKRIKEIDPDVLYEYVMATLLIIPELEHMAPAMRTILHSVIEDLKCSNAVRNFSSVVSSAMKMDRDSEDERN